MDWSYIIATTGTLFFLMDTPGNVPVVQHLLVKVDPKRRFPLLLREMLIVLVLLFLFFFLGEEILAGLKLNPSSLSITGGIMLFLIALGMVFPPAASHDPQAHPAEAEPMIVPIAMPLIVGPAVIVSVMTLAAMSAEKHLLAEGIVAMLLAWAGSAIIMLFSGKILDILGERGSVALTRLMGTILVMIAVQMVLDGITKYFHLL